MPNRLPVLTQVDFSNVTSRKNIEELLEKLGKEFHVLRQQMSDAEFNDVLAGYELLTTNR